MNRAVLTIGVLICTLKCATSSRAQDLGFPDATKLSRQMLERMGEVRRQSVENSRPAPQSAFNSPSLIATRLAVLRSQKQATERIISDLQQQIAYWKSRINGAAKGNTTSLAAGNAMRATGSLHVEMARLRQINAAIQQLERQRASLGM